MVRTPCCRKEGVKKGAWTPEDDQKLVSYVMEHGEGGWRTLPEKAGLQRCGKSCRLRWTNYLRPDIKRGVFSTEEEETIINLHANHGNKWSTIARRLPGRTDNEIKNYWNTKIKKRLIQKGIDPVTHRPISEEKHDIPMSSFEEIDETGKESDLESETQKNSEVEQQKPVSGSVLLLNKVANKFGLRVSQSVLTQIIEGANSHSSTLSSTSFASETPVSDASSTKIETFQTEFINNFTSKEPSSELSQPKSGDFEDMWLENWIGFEAIDSAEIFYDHSWQDCAFELTDFLETSNLWTDGFMKDSRDSFLDERLERD